MTYEPIVLEKWDSCGWKHFLRIRQDGNLEVVYNNMYDRSVQCPFPGACLNEDRRPSAKGE